MKIHEYAKEKNLSSKDIVEFLNDNGFEVKNHMSTMTDEMIHKYENTVIKSNVDTKEVDNTKKTAKKKKSANKRKDKNAGKDTRKDNVPVKKEVETEEHVVYFTEEMTIGDWAEQMNVPSSKIIAKLMGLGIMASINQSVDRDTVELVSAEFDYEVKDKVVVDLDNFENIDIVDSEEDLQDRPAVVTVMGHVDHGKTTLLDAIRSANVVSGEAGGITQHIGAYQVSKKGQKITFIDTPGHAAFTEMRARGAKVTDITILVVAADDGVMPQTEEAIHHAKAAGVPIIVAVNKMDKPGANPDRVMQELTEYDLLSEDWGGDTIFVQISALSAQGIDDLLEMIMLVTEMEELKANPNRLATGSVIEAKLDKGQGSVATLLVQNGTLKTGDIAVVGDTYGKIRAMFDCKNKLVKVAPPSMPVKVLGLDEVPKAGDSFIVINDEKQARNIAKSRANRTKSKDLNAGSKAVSLDDVFAQIKEGQLKQVNVIVKGDVQGSVEALCGSLQKIDVEGVKVNIIRKGVGTISETDVTLAAASNAILMGFNVRPNAQTREIAERENVDVRLYNVIYKAIEELELAMQGMLDPEYEEVVIGQAEVRQTFKVSKLGTIAGSYVTSGEIRRDSGVRVIRDGVVVYEGKLSTLKRFKDDVKTVATGYECGIMVENYNDVKEQDVFECFVEQEIKK